MSKKQDGQGGGRDVDARLAAYLPPAEALEKRPMPLLARSALYLLLLFLVLAVVWAGVSHIDRVVTASGRLIATVPDVSLSPLENSILKAVHVRVGDRVRAGEVVATLDPTFSQADLASLEKRQIVIRAQMARLDAELDGRRYQSRGCGLDDRLGARPSIEPPAMAPRRELAGRRPPITGGLTVIATEKEATGTLPRSIAGGRDRHGCAAQLLQQRISLHRQAAYEARLATYGEELAVIEAAQATTASILAGIKRRLELEAEIVGMYDRLSQSQIASKLQVLEVRREVVQLEAEQARLARLQIRQRQEAKRITADRRAFADEWMLGLINERLELQNEKDALLESLAKARRMSELVALKAPIDGTVLEIAAGLSVGSIIAETEPIITLSAIDVPLEADVEIPARDIGRVRSGDTVRVKVEAFPFQRHGIIEGRLAHISADAFARAADEGGGSYFRGRIDLGEARLNHVPDDMRLSPGMNVVAEMVVGDRRVLSYFLYPIFRSLDEAIREP